jgi:hypothetical protein
MLFHLKTYERSNGGRYVRVTAKLTGAKKVLSRSEQPFARSMYATANRISSASLNRASDNSCKCALVNAWFMEVKSENYMFDTIPEGKRVNIQTSGKFK